MSETGRQDDTGKLYSRIRLWHSTLAFDLASIGAAVHGAGGAEGGSATGWAGGGRRRRGRAAPNEGSGRRSCLAQVAWRHSSRINHMRNPQGMGALAGISAAAVAREREARGRAGGRGECTVM